MQGVRQDSGGFSGSGSVPFRLREQVVFGTSR